MQLDSVLNLQAEVFKDVFGFVEAPQAMASAAAVEGIPSYVNPRVLDESVVQPEVFAVSAEEPVIRARAYVSDNQVLMTDRALGRSQHDDTDRMALGVGRKADGATGEFELAVVYQDRRPQYGSVLKRIEAVGGGEVRMIYSGKIRAAATWHRQRNDPLRMGSSVAHRSVSAGTLACFVKHRASGQVGILSNNHILANTNNAAIGDEIRQPGRSDGGVAADRMASLAGFIPLLFGGAPNQVDCAWATHDAPPRGEDRVQRFDSAEIVVGQLLGTVPQEVLPGSYVTKTGRTTGYTQGEVDLINVNNLTVDMGGGAIARFDGQIQIKGLSALPFSARGDSGSLIVDNNSDPIGLLFATSSSGGFENTGLTWANPIGPVLNQLNLDIVR